MASTSAQTADSTQDRIISKTELAKHKRKISLWIAIKGIVYDVTSFVNDHPGGSSILWLKAGTDATKAFDAVNHTEHAKTVLDHYKIGKLKVEW